MEWEFKKITLEQMMTYIEANAPQDKQWFKSVAFEMRSKKKAVKQFDEDGNPVMITCKNGKQRQAVKLEEVKGSKKEPVFSLIKAKYAFCDRYMPEVIPVAKGKKKKASDMLADW